MKTLKIDRKKWSRGGKINCGLNESGTPRTYLWDKSVDAGCCLGHYCIQLANLGPTDLNKLSEPSDLGMNIDGLAEATYNEYHDVSYGDNTDFTQDAMGINDDNSITEEEREAKLIELFRLNDIALEFYN